MAWPSIRLETKRALLFGVVGTSVFVAVFGFRFWAIFHYALSLPGNDEWYSEWDTLYRPCLEGNLHFYDLFLPNHEHVIALQKGLHLALFWLLGEWNPPLLMVFNSLLFSAFVGTLAFLACRFLRKSVELIPFVGILVLLCCLPGTMENYLFGFQTMWPLYYLLSFLTCVFFCRTRTHPLLFYAGLLCAVLSTLCLASGILNVMLAAIPLLLLLGPQRNPRVLSPFPVLLLRSLLVAVCAVAVVLLPSEHAQRLVGWKSMVSGLVEGLAWPAPRALVAGMLIPLLWILRFETRRMLNHAPPRLELHVYLLAWCLLHIVATSAARGGFEGRHIELLCLSVLATWFATRRVAMEFTGKLFRTAMGLWYWVVFVCVLAQCFSGWHLLGWWKYDWLTRYEGVFRYFYRGDKHALLGQSRDRGNLIDDFLRVQPELLKDRKLGRVLHCVPSAQPWFRPAVDLALNDNLRTNTLPPHPFVAWCRLDSGQDRDLEMREVGAPFVKLNLYGDFTTGSLVAVNPRHGETVDLQRKLCFGQPPGWQSVFLRTGTGHLGLRLKAPPGGWCVLQVPQRCSWAQYCFEKAGRSAELLVMLGVIGLVWSMVELMRLERDDEQALELGGQVRPQR